MGSGSYSYSAYANESCSRGIDTLSTDALFSNRRLSKSADIKTSNIDARRYNIQVAHEAINVGVRECRDTEEHPYSTPIIIALDVTGSMRKTPHQMIKDCFPKLMDAITQLGVKDPQLLFMAVGDHEYDLYPIQVGQFESDTAKILDQLQEFVLEGGGGGNAGESYLLAHLIAGYHTEIDSWFKRKTKGLLFTIGDEPNLKRIGGSSLTQFLGYEKGAKEMSAQEVLAKAEEQYNVFHIHITNGSRPASSVMPGWTALLGQNVLKADSSEVHNVIAETIRQYYIEPTYVGDMPVNIPGIKVTTDFY